MKHIVYSIFNKKAKMEIFFDGRNNDVENKKINLYNDTIKKGDVALLGS